MTYALVWLIDLSYDGFRKRMYRWGQYRTWTTISPPPVVSASTQLGRRCLNRSAKPANTGGAQSVRIIVQRMTYSPEHGLLALTVPLFDAFMRPRMDSEQDA